MALAFRTAAFAAPPPSNRLVSGDLFRSSVFSIPKHNSKNLVTIHSYNRHLRSVNSTGINDDGLNGEYSGSNEGSETKGDGRKESFSSKEMLKKLKRYGVSGILSYGLLNTAYYLTTFLLVWFYFAPAPGKMGFAAAAQRFLKIMAMVWAGSQVTKLVRAGGALALAPLVDRGLSWFTKKFRFESQGKAFLAIVGFCFGLALLLFFVVTLLSA